MSHACFFTHYLLDGRLVGPQSQSKHSGDAEGSVPLPASEPWLPNP
jgi:hypothetical protein